MPKPGNIVIKVNGKVVYEGPSGDVDVKHETTPAGGVFSSIFGGRATSTSVTIKSSGDSKIHIEGDIVGNLTSDMGVRCGDVGGDVDAGMQVDCLDVQGSVDAGMGVTCNDVQGDVDAGMNVTAHDIFGRADAGMSIRAQNIHRAAK